jgi:4-deoxy-L-threo-5-hexosulose-uronate ketol-isomerase
MTLAMNHSEYNERYASQPSEVKHYDTPRLRQEFLIESLFEENKAKFTYSYYDRFIIGGIVPKDHPLELEAITPIKAPYFCERREIGLINIGGNASVTVDGTKYRIGMKEALYIGQSTKKVIFESDDKNNPSFLYLNSAPAHKSYTTRLIKQSDANVLELGSEAFSNQRKIRQLIVTATCQTCQLQMGITELQPGNVWNTMPPHTHNRRMEVYLYTDVPENQAVCHFMGVPEETRHIWLINNQAVISPHWSIHSAAGTSSYSFIWGMAGENLDFTDMDALGINDLK